MTIAIPRLDRSTAADRGLTVADFLVPITLAERIDPRVRHIALIVSGALLIFVTAQVYIARTPVPLTGQTFGVLVVGGALGARRGFAAVALYVLLGLVGLPFFAEGKGGAAVILGATGGYLIGFMLAGAVVGRLAELGWDRHLGGSIAMMVLGSVAIVRHRPAMARRCRRVFGPGDDRLRSDALHRLGRGQAGGRGGYLPGRLVADRSSPGRPLTQRRRPSRAQAAGSTRGDSSAAASRAARLALRLRYESRRSRATSRQ